MSVAVDINGVLTVTSHPATQGLSGRYFVRRQPLGDDGDAIVVNGAMDVGQYTAEAELVISSATFAAVPAGWHASAITYNLEDFAEEYRPMNDAERAVLALDHAATSMAADEAIAAADRTHPWRRA